MTEVAQNPVAEVAKVLEENQTTPKALEDCTAAVKEAAGKEENVGSKAPPSTPIRRDSEVEPENSGDAGTVDEENKKKKPKSYSNFPKFRVTWDPKIPSLMSLKNPKKKSRNIITERYGISMAQEMSPQATLVEFIVTSASFHGVKRQSVAALEDELFRVFRNNIMPANAAAWYMAKRRFYNKGVKNQLLALLLKEYPKKFAMKNNVVQFLESYSPVIARSKLRYLVEQGLYAYFSHKADEYGVYFFDPLYYEETEPFHAGMRIVTNTYNNGTPRLTHNFFKQYKKQFNYHQISPYLACISKNENEIISGVTGVVLTMVDKKYGLIKFNRGTETCVALFSINALFKDGYVYRRDPKTLPPVYLDAYKIPNLDKTERFQWFAVLTWVGRKPNPKFCSNKDELTNCAYYKVAMSNTKLGDPSKKEDDKATYMKMGTVSDIKKNGAVAVVVKEDGEKESYFVPGWMYQHINTPKGRFMTTTQGVGLCVGDLINFYVDPKLEAKPYVAVACNVDVLKHVDNVAKGSKSRRRRRTTSSQQSKKSTTRTRQWKKYLLVEDVEDSQTESDADPDYKPPEYLDDSTDAESDISENELNDLVESMNKDLKVDDLLPKEAEKDDESPKEPAEEKAAEPTDKTDVEKEAVAN